MCGIFGAAFVDRTIDPEAALASMRYRGPDASRVTRLDGCVLGHLRLAILDLSPGASQPMSSSDVWLVFNGEIYNHHELRTELATRGHAFRTRSDTEVILEGYRAWGDSVVERIDGMFALAVFDARRRRLLLARDRAGKKPLFTARVGPGIVFGSEIKALRASGVDAAMDIDALPTLLSLGYNLAPRTMFRGVEQLAPASILTLEDGATPVTRRYWRASFAEPRLSLDEREAEALVRTEVDAAVKRRIEADVPLGAFLSGGIDSTIVVGSMSAQMGRRVKTFSLGFAQDSRFDETRYSRIAAKAFDTDHTEFIVEPSSFDLVGQLVDMHDGPFGDASAIPTSIVSMLARKHVTVALTGDGGDEIFCGYPRFTAVEKSEHVPRPLRPAGHVLAAMWGRHLSEDSRMGRLGRLLRRGAMSLPDRLASYVSLFAFDLDQLLVREIAERASAQEALAAHRRIARDLADAPTLARIMGINFETYLPFDLLVKADRASMMHSLELRSPLLDTRVVELASRLPADYLRKGGVLKRVLRNAFRDVLPPEIVARRDKMGFGVPLGTWLSGDLRTYMTDLLGDGARLWRFVRRPFVDAIMRNHLSGRRDEGLRLWLLLTLEVWLRSLEDRARSR